MRSQGTVGGRRGRRRGARPQRVRQRRRAARRSDERVPARTSARAPTATARRSALAYDVGGAATSRSTTPPTPGSRRPSTSSTPPARRPRPRPARTTPTARSACVTLAEGGYDTIIGGRLHLLASPSTTSRPDYPEVNFGIIDGFNPTKSQEPLPNVANINFAANEGSFLVGVAAALTTKADTSASSAASNRPADPGLRGRLRSPGSRRSTPRSRSRASTCRRTTR